MSVVGTCIARATPCPWCDTLPWVLLDHGHNLVLKCGCMWVYALPRVEGVRVWNSQANVERRAEIARQRIDG